jgi:beta-lactamase class A
VVELTRRQALIAPAALVGATALNRPSTAAAAPPGDRFAALETQYNARLGLYAADLLSSRVVAYRDGDRFALCSTFKTYAAGRVLQMVDHGQLRLDNAVPITAGDIVSNSPVTQQAAGRTLTLADLCAAALQQSDNTAANLLLHSIGGPPAVTEFARQIGDDQTRLDRWEPDLNTVASGDDGDTTTAGAIAAGYRALLTARVLSAHNREQLVGWMRGNVTSSMRAGLPPGWTSADKTGSGDYGTSNDVGVAYGPNGQLILLAVMARSASDNPTEPTVRPLVGDTTKAVFAVLAQ